MSSKNVSLAIINATEMKKRFPAAAYWGGPDKNVPGPHHNWVVEVLRGINLSLANSGDHKINSGQFKAEGESPWPNSFHPGGVCVSFADGRAQFLNEEIAGRVSLKKAGPAKTTGSLLRTAAGFCKNHRYFCSGLMTEPGVAILPRGR